MMAVVTHDKTGADQLFGTIEPQVGARSPNWTAQPVAFLATTYSYGGLERLSVRLAEELRAVGGDIRFICAPESPLSAACAERSIPRNNQLVRNSADYAAAKNLATYLVDEGINILHVHSRRDFVPAVIAVKIAAKKKQRKTALVLHVHQIRRLGDGGRLSDLFFNWGADKVLTASNAVHRKVTHRSWINPSMVEVLANGIDIRNYPLPASSLAAKGRSEMRQKWGVESNSPLVGVVGRLGQKGQLFLLQEAPKILADFPNLKFVFIGSDSSPKIQKSLTDIVKAKGISDQVIFAGTVDDMPASYAALDFLIHLPIDEAFGLAIAEAMASSLPVIASNMGGCQELIKHLETGLLIKPRNAVQLSDAVKYVLSPRNSLEISKLRRRARLSIESNFTLQKQVDDLSATYDRLTYEICNPHR